MLPATVGIVEMTFEESVHFGLENGRVLEAEWLSLREPWSHSGYVRLGQEKRVFAVTMFHQLHCVDMIARAMFNPDNVYANEAHVHHCLSYLRKIFLCSADATLEPYDFMTRNYTSQPVGLTRQCRDWSAVYGAVEANYGDWVKWSKSHDYEVSPSLHN